MRLNNYGGGICYSEQVATSQARGKSLFAPGAYLSTISGSHGGNYLHRNIQNQ
jgi:hypothetical protein